MASCYVLKCSDVQIPLTILSLATNLHHLQVLIHLCFECRKFRIIVHATNNSRRIIYKRRTGMTWVRAFVNYTQVTEIYRPFQAHTGKSNFTILQFSKCISISLSFSKVKSSSSIGIPKGYQN